MPLTPVLDRPLPRRRLRPARHRRLRPAALPEARARRPAAQLRRRAPTARGGSARRARKYTTPDSVEDLEAIRADLGVERLTLFGISYGTELALAYARAHPDRVDRLILDSVVDPDDRDPFGLAGFRAMAPSARRAVPGRCRGVSADPIADVADAGRAAADARRCAGAPTTAAARPPASPSGRPRSPTCSTTPTTTRRCAPRVPAAVRAALRGRRRAAGAARRRGQRPGRPARRRKSFSSARYATVCEETPLPWDASTPFDGRLGGGAPARGRARAGRVRARSTCAPPRPTRSGSACAGRACRRAACPRPRRRIPPCRR